MEITPHRHEVRHTFGIAMNLWKRAMAAFALTLVATAASAIQEAFAMSLDSIFNAVVTEGGVEIEQNIVYGPRGRHRLDIYRAAHGREVLPVVIFYYGGGWTKGERSTYQFLGAALATRGITTVIPDYRLFPEVQFPDFVDDAARAYRWTSERFTEGCPAGRPVIVMGHSAGAYMAAMLALDATLSSGRASTFRQPAAFIGLAGPYAFDPTTWPSTRAIFTRAASEPDRARPIAFARPGAPPTLLVHGRDDTMVQLYNSRDLATALQTRGNIVRSIEYPDIGHVGLVLAIARPFRWRAPVLEDVVAFIKTHGGSTLLGHTCTGTDAGSGGKRSRPR
jgi:acetyl esterase/lipase